MRSSVEDSTRFAGVLALVLTLLAYAYSPLLGSGFLGPDFATLLSLEESAAEPGVARFYAPEACAARPLATLSLHGSRALWTEGGRWTGAEALVLRLEHLLLALVAAAGLHGLMRRALTPWLGVDPAKAAAHTGAALFLLHPLLVASVGRVASRGDLIALACGAWAVRTFLAARQERRVEGVLFAAAATLACGLSSELVLLLPPLLAGLEYLSARRHRPRLRRVRTALATFAGFALVASLEWAGRLTWAPEAWRGWLPGPRPEAGFALAMEKLGVILLPVDTHGIGSAGYLVAAFAVLLALHPGFVAARSAPRLWGRILLGWGLSLAAASAPHLGTRVPPGSLQRADLLLAAGIVMAVGFGISATALSGWRRAVVPVLTGGLFAILGRAVSLPREEAADEVLGLQQELFDAARERDWRTTLIVLEPPREIAGVDALGPGSAGLEALVAAPFLPEPARAGEPRVVVHGVDRETFRAWRREEEFRALRERGAMLIVDARLLGLGPERERVGLELAPPGGGESRAIWRGGGRSPSDVTLDPLEACFFEVSALPEAATDAPPVIRWSSIAAFEHDAPRTGVWIERGATPEACFDLEDDLVWLLGRRVRSVWFPGDLMSLAVTGRAGPGPRPLSGELEPRPAGDDWLFEIEREPDLGVPGTWRLTALDLARLEVREWAPDESSPAGRVRFLGADAWTRGVVEAGRGPVAWTLDRRAEDVTVARARGRVQVEFGALPIRQE